MKWKNARDPRKREFNNLGGGKRGGKIGEKEGGKGGKTHGGTASVATGIVGCN